MTEVIFTILVFIGVIAVTAVLFLGWMFFSIARFFIRSMRGPTGQRHTAMGKEVIQMRCLQDRCGAPNPIHARYCRRCGHEMTQAQSSGFQRAAML